MRKADSYYLSIITSQIKMAMLSYTTGPYQFYLSFLPMKLFISVENRDVS